MQGIKKLDRPLEVNTIDWAFQHLGCNALVIRDDEAVPATRSAYLNQVVDMYKREYKPGFSCERN